MKESKCAKKKAASIVVLIVAACAVMALIELAVEPPYAVKSAVKVLLFLGVPTLYCLAAKDNPSDTLRLPPKKLLWILLTGAAIYLVILLAYFASGGIFDYGEIVSNLASDQNVTKDRFWSVALYISFGNSLVEEVLFRLFGFLMLSESVPLTFAYAFSAAAFALYHIGMIGQSFSPALILLSLVGLAVGGLIFDWFDWKFRSFYGSWFIHMFADFAIMTIWFLPI